MRRLGKAGATINEYIADLKRANDELYSTLIVLGFGDMLFNYSDH